MSCTGLKILIFSSPVTICQAYRAVHYLWYLLLCGLSDFFCILLDVLCPLIPLKRALLCAGNWTSDFQNSLSTNIFQWSYDYLIIPTSFALLLKFFQAFCSTKIFKFFIVVYESCLFVCIVSFLSCIPLSCSQTLQIMFKNLPNKASKTKFLWSIDIIFHNYNYRILKFHCLITLTEGIT